MDDLRRFSVQNRWRRGIKSCLSVEQSPLMTADGTAMIAYIAFSKTEV